MSIKLNKLIPNAENLFSQKEIEQMFIESGYEEIKENR